MVRRLGQSTSKTAALVGCSRSAVVSIYQKIVQGRSSGETATGSWVAKAHWCTWGAKAGLCGLIQQTSHCSSNCWVGWCWTWKKVVRIHHAGGCIAADQSGCPCWALSTAKSTDNRHMSVRTGPRSNGRRWLGVMNHVSFNIRSMAWCKCVAYLGNTWHQDALWEEGKPAEAVICFGQCSAGKPWSCHPCGCYFDMYHLP